MNFKMPHIGLPEVMLGLGLTYIAFLIVVILVDGVESHWQDRLCQDECLPQLWQVSIDTCYCKKGDEWLARGLLKDGKLVEDF